MDQKPDFCKRPFFHKGGHLRKKKNIFCFLVSIFTHQSKALIKLLQKMLLIKSFRLIPKKKFQKIIFILRQKGFLEKSGFWSIKIRTDHMCLFLN
jgi:hypothetical protein